jgi:hypothetical protein
MNARLIWIVVGVVLVMIAAVIGVVALSVMLLFKALDRSDAHVCGLAAVTRSQEVAALLGSPIRQTSWTMGSSNTDNGALAERITFTVTGPQGDGSVVSDGKRSQGESHLLVTVGKGDQTVTAYDGAFDCPELHPQASPGSTAP